jgi:hypothetical protein
MATYHAIAAIGQALVRLLTDASKGEADFANATFRLAQAADFQESADGLGVLVFLYRVAANGARRNLPPRHRPGLARTRPPLPLDLYYLLSPWAANADTQQRLLGWTMRTLDDTPILPVALLNADDASPDEQTFYPEEAVELVYDPLSLQDLANLWEIVKPRTQAGATYAARMVAIESTVTLVEAGPVQTRELGFGTPVERVPLGARR